MTTSTETRQLTGWHVLAITVGAFAIIIAVNMTLAFKAVSTFPGLEVKNSYVASQKFDAARAAQRALGWEVLAEVSDGVLTLGFTDADGKPVQLGQLEATLGRATHVQDDRSPVFAFDGAAYRAPVDLVSGYWNLRVKGFAADGTLFQQRIELYVK